MQRVMMVVFTLGLLSGLVACSSIDGQVKRAQQERADQANKELSDTVGK